MKKLIVGLLLSAIVTPVFGDSLQWQIPGGVGSLQLPFQSTELLLGYDVVLKQGIGGVSLPVLTLGKLKSGETILDGQLGAVGAFPTQSSNIEPYLALGHNVIQDIPTLNQFKSLHLNAFSRWDTSQGGSFHNHLGAGLSASYSFN